MQNVTPFETKVFTYVLKEYAASATASERVVKIVITFLRNL
jgi:hypothetical protein